VNRAEEEGVPKLFPIEHSTNLCRLLRGPKGEVNQLGTSEMKQWGFTIPAEARPS